MIRRVFSNPSNVLVFSNAIALLLGVASAAIQARALGPVGRGELATAMVPGTLLAMLTCLGLPDYFSRRVAIDGDRRARAGNGIRLSRQEEAGRVGHSFDS